MNEAAQALQPTVYRVDVNIYNEADAAEWMKVNWQLIKTRARVLTLGMGGKELQMWPRMFTSIERHFMYEGVHFNVAGTCLFNLTCESPFILAELYRKIEAQLEIQGIQMLPVEVSDFVLRHLKINGPIKMSFRLN